MSMNKCPPDSLQSFPVDMGFSLTNTTYTQAKKTPLSIQFTWGTRTTAPNFSYATSGIIDHTQNDYSTTLTYNDSLYTLGSVQLCSPTHNRWLDPQSLGVTKLDNKEDVVMTYQRDTFARAASENDPAIIILVNPIFRNDSQNGNPLYLSNMANKTASPVTLESLFPYISTNNYVYYTTCVNGITTQDPYKNILVLLNVEGTLVSESLMVKIKDMYSSFSKGNYPQYIPLATFNTRSNKPQTIISLREGFVGKTAGVTSPSGGPAPTAATSSAFTVEKCVPFDPETQVGSDGIIVLDNGKPVTMDSVINARNGVKNTWNTEHKGTIAMSTVETSFVYALVGALCLAGLAALASFVTDATILPFMIDVLLKGLGGLVVGFFVGMYVLPAKCPVCPSSAPPASSGTGGS